MSNLPPLVILFGRSGAGKGTLAQLLVSRHGFVQCSTGQAMRTWAEGKRPEQRALKAALARGEYGSDELAARIVREFLEALPEETPGVILDGFPRNPVQLQSFLNEGTSASRVRLLGIEVETPEALCRARLARRGYCPSDGWTRQGLGPCEHCTQETQSRADDGDGPALDHRFVDYLEQVEPTIALWRRLGLPLQRVRNDDRGHPLRIWARWIALHLHHA